MFVVRIIDKENNIHDNSFDNNVNAISYYKNTDVNDEEKRSISIIDKRSNTITCIKLFKNETSYELKNGDIVRIRPEYRTKEEAQYTFVVSDINENTERCSITCINSGMTIPSKEIVGIEMVKTI